MTIIFVRHGESESNRQECFEAAGHFEGSHLTSYGRTQIRQLAIFLSETRQVDEIYSGPSLRTRETASILGEFLGPEVAIADELSEIDCGEWSGQPFSAVEASYAEAWKKWKEMPMQFLFPGGESLACVDRRVRSFVDEIRAIAFKRTVLLVSHSATITVMLARFLDWDLNSAWADKRSYHKNSAVTVLGQKQGGLELLSSEFGSLEHIKG
jgi:broad specificity phosphatase PhoE